MSVGRPNPDEYPPFASGYVSRVPGENLLSVLSDQVAKTTTLLESIGESRAGLSYAPGKWTVKEALCHITDAERIFSARLLRIARGDTTPLPKFDQDSYVPVSGANQRSLASLLEEFNIVRKATLCLLASLPQEAWLRRGTVSSFPCAVRGIAYLLAGHELHHFDIFNERYIPAL